MQIRIEIAVVKGSHSQKPKFYENHTFGLLNQCVFTLRCCAPPSPNIKLRSDHDCFYVQKVYCLFSYRLEVTYVEFIPLLKMGLDDYEESKRIIKQLEHKSRRVFKCNLLPKRYLLAILSFFGFLNIYASRASLTVAIVAMVTNRTVVDSSGNIITTVKTVIILSSCALTYTFDETL